MMQRIVDRAFGSDHRARINHFAAAGAGVLFFTGWWIMLDVHGSNLYLLYFYKVYYVPGIFSTIGFVIIVTVPNNSLKPDDFYGDTKCPKFCGLIFMFLGFFILFSSLIGAFYIYLSAFVLNIYEKDSVERQLHEKHYPGVGILLHSLLIFFATFVYKFAIKFEED